MILPTETSLDFVTTGAKSRNVLFPAVDFVRRRFTERKFHLTEDLEVCDFIVL